MRCNNCMKEIPSGSAQVKFCPYCGKNPNKENPPQQPSANLPKNAPAPPAYTRQPPYQESRYNYPTYPSNPVPPPKKKNNTALIAALISAAAVVIAAATVLVIIMLNSGSDDSTSPETTAATGVADTAEVGSTSAVKASDTYVKAANVTGKKLAEAKKALEDQGLVVKIVEEQSDTAAKGYVIRQTPSENISLKKGDSVTLYVSKGSAHGPDGYDQKVVVSAESGSSYANLTMYEWKDGKWSKLFSCEATVGKNGGISSDNSESNTLTPKGTFRLGVVLATRPLDTKMKMYSANAETVICDDTSSPYYNQIGQKSSFGSYHTDSVGKKLSDGYNNALIFIEHNGNGFSSDNVSKDNSSVITICGCNSSIEPTNGCIDISASDMTALLKLLDENKSPHITTEVK